MKEKTMYEKKLESNIWKYYVMQFFYLFHLFGAILTLYFLDLGFSIFTIALFASVTGAVKLILEIPSGIISDKYGRKISLLISSSSFILMVLFFALAKFHVTYAFMGFVFAGVKISFKSGSDGSLIQDTLKELKRSKEVGHVLGRGSSYYFLGCAIASLIGPFIAKFISIRYLLYSNLVSGIILILVVLSLTEPKSKKSKHAFGKHFIESLKVMLINRKLLWMALLLAFTKFVIMASFVYPQVFFNNFNLDLRLFGIIYFVWMVITSATSYFYGKIKDKVSDSWLLGFMILLLPICIIGIGVANSIYAIIALFSVVEVIFGILFPLDQHFIQREVEAKFKATVFSNKSLLVSLFEIVIGGGLGALAVIIGLYNMFIVFGATVLVVLIICFVKLRRYL